MERASGKFEVVTAMLDHVLGDEDDDKVHAPTAFEKSAEEAGRYQAAAFFNDCLVDWGVDVKNTTREEMKHCRHQVLEELDSRGTEIVEIAGGEVISKPNYLPTLDRDDVMDVVDAFMHCTQAADAVRIIGPALEGCKMEAKEVHHDAAGNGSSFTDQFANKIAGDNADARRTRKFIDVKADAIGDHEFKEKLDKVMYQPGRSKDEVRDAFKGLLNEAKEDLNCDPQGLKAKPCNEFKFPSMNDRQGDNQRMPIAHKFEGHMKSHSGQSRPSGMSGTQGYQQPTGGHQQGINTDITKEQFDKVFSGGHDSEMRGRVGERVAECEADGNSINECLKDVKNDMRNKREGHRNFNQDEFHKQRDQMAKHHQQNFAGTQSGPQQGMPGQPEMANMPGDHQNHFGAFGDGAGKRGHHQMMECMMGNAGAGQDAQFNSAGDYSGGHSFGDAADNCMADASEMMEGSFGNRDMGNHAGMVGTHGSTGTMGSMMQGMTTGGSQQ